MQSELEAETKSYISFIKENNREVKPVAAFALFRSVEGAERMKDCFKKEKSLFGTKVDEKKMFKD